jgi:Flp pilus assembly pilin Flp
MDAIKRIFPLGSGAGPVEYAIIAAGVCLAIAAVVTLRCLVFN